MKRRSHVLHRLLQGFVLRCVRVCVCVSRRHALLLLSSSLCLSPTLLFCPCIFSDVASTVLPIHARMQAHTPSYIVTPSLPPSVTHAPHSLPLYPSHRCDHSILKSTLPPKYEHVLYTRPSEVQMKLYNYAQEQAQTHNKTGAGLNPIVAFSTFTKIWNHPDIFHQFTRGSKETAVRTPTHHTCMSGLMRPSVAQLCQVHIAKYYRFHLCDV